MEPSRRIWRAAATVGTLFVLLTAPGRVEAQNGRLLEGAEAERYYQILRDAQEAQRQALEQGRVKLEITYIPEDGDTGRLQEITVTIQAEVIWSGSRMLLKYRAEDPRARVATYPDESVPLEERPWKLALRTPDAAIVYNTAFNIAHVRPPGSSVTHSPLLKRLVPREKWTGCCGLTSGRPWNEMIGPQPPFDEHEFELWLEEGGRTLRQVRTAPDGRVMETVFSLDKGGLVTRWSSRPKRRSGPVEKGEYVWSDPVDGRCVLREFKLSRHEPSRYEYHLRVLEADLDTPVPASTFSQAAFFREFAEGTKVRDHVAGKTRYVDDEGRLRLRRPPNRVTTERLNELAEQLRARGLAKPK